MTQEISSLMDGELDPQDGERVIRSCCSNGEAAEKWHMYNLIGDAMRDEVRRPSRTLDRVREALVAEPAMIARPKRIYETTLGRIAFAAAASVATIGVVGWIGNQGGQVPSGAVVARAPGTVQPALIPAADIQDYVVAHRQLPSAELYRPVVNSRGAPAAPAR
jgi:negative regulator of sigma E activity